MLKIKENKKEITKTPLIRVDENILVKLENRNPTGSHKYRAAKFIVNKAIADGHLEPFGEKRIIEKSGGNLGVGLAFEAGRLGIGVDLVIGLSFSPLKRSLCEQFGARLIGLELLKEGMQPKQIISKVLEENGEQYFFTDQFNNIENFQAHYEETGTEILNQLQDKMLQEKEIILVKGAGTGASITGISQRLKENFKSFRVFLVYPSGCDIDKKVFSDHNMEGTMVGVYPPFLNLNSVDEMIAISNDQAIEGQRMFAKKTGIFPGVSSGANFYAASVVSQKFRESIILTVAYDQGEGYLLKRVIENDEWILSNYSNSVKSTSKG